MHLLRLKYPGAYVAYLKAMGKTEEIQKLYDGYENFTWYIVGEIIPELHKLRSEDRLKKGKGEAILRRVNLTVFLCVPRY